MPFSRLPAISWKSCIVHANCSPAHLESVACQNNREAHQHNDHYSNAVQRGTTTSYQDMATHSPMINDICNYVPCSVRVPHVAHLLTDPLRNWPEFFPLPPKLCLCATPTQSICLMVEQCHLRPQHLEEPRHQKSSTKASVPPVCAF